MSTDNDIAEFEALPEIVNYFKMHGDIEHKQYGGYFSGGKPSFYLNGAYFGFRALKAKLEGCVVVPTTPSYEMWSGIARHLGRYMQMHDRYCPQTLKKYFGRFIGDIPEWLNKEVKDWDSDHAFATADLPAFIYMSMVEAARGGK